MCSKSHPRKITGARNVTRQPAFSNETIELSQSILRVRFDVCLEFNSTHARDEMDFRSRSRDMIKKEKPGEAGL
ncbi:hypothetical protein [Bradyrhizobium hereditatis]|uniref:hypothetical protein n=1 Tax=Bradyrhizobium hereditatis TaxID=2821405 RepID=UPI001CE38BC2|nr:hypothetical protein [Bradyrhizobium hereditatis]